MKPIALHGNDEWRIQREIKARCAGVSEMWHSFNVTITSDPQEAMAQIRTPPFGEGDRVVVWQDCTLLSKKDEDLWAEFKRAIALIADHCVLILVGSVDGRLKATKEFKAMGEVVEFALPSPWDVPAIESLVRAIAQGEGIALDAEVPELLAASIGADSRRLHSELVRLGVMCGGCITADAVQGTVDRTTQTALNLAESLIKGRAIESMQLVRELVAMGQHPLQIVATLINRCRKYWMVASLKGDNADIAKIADIGNPKQIYPLRKEVGAIAPGYAENVLIQLLETECAIKSGAQGERAIELMVQRVLAYGR